MVANLLDGATVIEAGEAMAVVIICDDDTAVDDDDDDDDNSGVARVKADSVKRAAVAMVNLMLEGDDGGCSVLCYYSLVILLLFVPRK
jgi:hypothetical protein